MEIFQGRLQHEPDSVDPSLKAGPVPQKKGPVPEFFLKKMSLHSEYFVFVKGKKYI